MRSVFDEVKSVAAVRPLAASAAMTQIWIDTLGYGSAMFIVENGAATGTPTSYTVDAKVQESDASNGSSPADISGAAIVQITADNKIAQIRVDGLGQGGRKRYLGLLITPALSGGSSPKALLSGHCLLGRPTQHPVGNSTTGA